MDIILEKHLNQFNKIIADEPYGQSGMFNSEIFIVYVLYKELNCNLFIESGLDWGISTKKFLSLIEDEYIGIDINQNCVGGNLNSNNFKFMCGDSMKLLPEIINEKLEKSIFVMIDGPKGLDAIKLKNELLEYRNVKCVAMHDTYDGLEKEDKNRIFETKNNIEYYEKYFNMLNNIENIVNIFNLMNYNNKTYSETFPTGPGVSIYSKLKINFVL